MYKLIDFNSAISLSEEYFHGDQLAANVFVTKYSLMDNHGNVLEGTPDDMHRRMARDFSRIESKYPNPMSEEEIYNLFKDFKYVVPQGSPMAGIGNNHRIQSLSNCFVIDEIIKTDTCQKLYPSIVNIDLFERSKICTVDKFKIR